MGIAVFLLLLFLAWAVVLPIWSLVASSRARMRAEDAERLGAERGRTAKAFARSTLALESTGKWRSEVPPVAPGGLYPASDVNAPVPLAPTPELAGPPLAVSPFAAPCWLLACGWLALAPFCWFSPGT